MGVVVLVGVVLRYALQIPNPYGEELSKYLLVLGIFIGIATGARKGAHIGVEMFVDKLPPKAQKFFMFFSQIFTIVIFVVLTYLSYLFLLHAINTNQISPAMHLPVWIIYLILPISFALSILRTTQALIEKVRQSPETGEKESPDGGIL